MLNMRVNKLILGAAIVGLSISSAFGREIEGLKKSKEKKSANQVLAEGCVAATSSADLNINNVRARILGSGDMWWDLNDAKYEVPKGSNKHSMFAGALWLGGYDEADQLKLAAMTYRQHGVDYWPGPLDDNASIEPQTCERYNRHWVVYRDEVELHKAWIECKEDPSCDPADRFPGYGESTIPKDIKDWPGNGVDGELPNKLAPYFEPDSSGTPGFYEPLHDYPGYDIDGTMNCQLKEVDLLYGDQTIWWVYNDKGNVHSETKAGALGFEIRAQAFAFTSNDELNNMTFYNYRILNKSTFRLTDTYFGTWFDPDLGNPRDDIIGCDIARGLGYCYNGDLDDEGPNGYGQNPPAIGFDFFQGPFADYFDGIDNDRDGCVDGVRDENGICQTEDPVTGINERIIMSGFMYYNNGGSSGVPQPTTDPDVAQEYYNYLLSKWKNGNNLIIENPSGAGGGANGDGYVAANTGTATRFAYPGLSVDTTGAYDPKSPVNWWESPANSADKRGLHSAGPFSLAPGALNFITTGVVWARNFKSTDLFASVNDVIVADDKAQQLFDNCFNVLDGPDSPKLKIVELDRELVFILQDVFNNKTLYYDQKDPTIPPQPQWNQSELDSARKAGYFNFRFEGFQIFQVKGPDVSVDNLYDPAQSRLIFESDLKNNVTQLVNYEVDADFNNNALVPVDKTLMTNNNGIELTYDLKEDAFASGDKRLINNKEYYFYVVAYSQNQYIIADPFNLASPSQKKPYLAGRNLGNGQKPYLGIPHKTENTNGGTTLNAQYGDGLPITRFSGAGNSGNFLRITDDSRQAIATNLENDEIHYEADSGPFDVKIVDPTSVVGGKYILRFSQTDPVDSASWEILSSEDPSKVIATSESNISFLGEQFVDDLGISVSFRNAERPGNDTLEVRNNGVIGGDQIFRNSKKSWLSGVSDDQSYTPTNWILGGRNESTSQPAATYSSRPGDPFGEFENILNGTWGPVVLGSSVGRGVVGNNFIAGFGIKPNGDNVPLSRLPNVDIVITSDPSMWTHCPVIELGDEPSANEGGAKKFTQRSARSLIKGPDGQLVPDPDANHTGWSYFPGYAVNVETGKRLCIVFGEDSWLKAENGADMLWNPSANLFDKLGNYTLGGMQVVYILADSVNTGTGYKDITYQGDDINSFPLNKELEDIKNASNSSSKLKFALIPFYRGFAWASIPLATSSAYEYHSYSDIPSDVRVELRVDKPYQRTDRDEVNNGYPQYEFNTLGLQTDHSAEVAKSALDLIRVVPNPYTGSSLYEDSQLDNVVKITNLPHDCKISIFMTNGTLVKTINKSNSQTYVEWDLKNDFNVPIASGIYIIHIDAGDLGQKVVKWMGTLRPVDLNAF